MSSKGQGSGPDLEDAIADAIGQVAGTDVTVAVKGLRDVTLTDVTVDVEATVTEVSDEPEEGEPANEDAPQEAAAAAEEETDDAEGPSLDDEADAAADFIEGVLDTLDLPGELKIRVNEVTELAEVEIVGLDGGVLIGRRGQTLEAIQELLRSAMQREFQQRSRVKVDVEGYRARRLEKYLDKAEEAIDAALATGEGQRLEPMDVFERKAVHRLVAEHEGVTSRSQGREPGRRVVIETE